MANFVSYSNMVEIMNAIGLKFDTLEGAYIPKGSVAFAGLPSTLTASMIGYVYNVNEDFTTDSRFVEGSGKLYKAGSNVVVVDASATSTPDYKFDVMGGFIDTTDIYNKITAAVSLVGDTFSASEAYSEGDYVIYNGAIYEFIDDHAAGAWDANDVDEVGTVLDLIDAIATQLSGDISTVSNNVTTVDGRVDDIAESIADEFADDTAYAAGDVVVKDDKLYKFNTAHAAGSWIGTDADEVTVSDLIDAAEPDDIPATGTYSIATLVDLLDNPTTT